MERRGQRLEHPRACEAEGVFHEFPITPDFSEYPLHSRRLACHLCTIRIDGCPVVPMRRKSSTCQTLKRPRADTQDIRERIRGNVFARQSSQRQAPRHWAQEGSGQILPRTPCDPNCTENRRSTPLGSNEHPASRSHDSVCSRVRASRPLLSHNNSALRWLCSTCATSWGSNMRTMVTTTCLRRGFQVRIWAS